jgi:hypothetical protein
MQGIARGSTAAHLVRILYLAPHNFPVLRVNHPALSHKLKKFLSKPSRRQPRAESGTQKWREVELLRRNDGKVGRQHRGASTGQGRESRATGPRRQSAVAAWLCRRTPHLAAVASRHCPRKDGAPLSEAASGVPLLPARHVFPNALSRFGKRRSGGNVKKRRCFEADRIAGRCRW